MDCKQKGKRERNRMVDDSRENFQDYNDRNIKVTLSSW